MLAHKLMGGGSASAPLYVDDVFQTHLYTGNGSTQTITNGIDLAGKGGLVWIKDRAGSFSHTLIDSARGQNFLSTDATTANTLFSPSAVSLDASGFSFTRTVGRLSSSSVNFASWTFRRAPKFFDCGTYTGNGVAGRQISHSLGVAPGMVIVKKTNSATNSNWTVYHRAVDATNPQNFFLQLESTAARYASTGFPWPSAPTSTAFSVHSDNSVNGSGDSYVWYAFAHDPSADGMIQCGSFTGTSKVTLGWEPQYILVKKSSFTSNWFIQDIPRGMPATGYSVDLSANTSSVEATGGYITIDATGFTPAMDGDTSIYLAIRRPNKPPTTGTEVFEAATFTGNGATQSVGTLPGVDLAIFVYRTATFSPRASFFDRLRGDGSRLHPSGTLVEATQPLWMQFTKNAIGVTVGPSSEENLSTYPRIGWLFKRAPGVFDIVCYTGTGSATTVAHNLGVAPELMIVKSRSSAVNWIVYDSFTGPTKRMLLDSTAATVVSVSNWNDTAPTSSVFTVGTGVGVNSSSTTYISYLFATKAGISKVGSYTGNGSTQTINCGFTTGSRFVLIKRTDLTGDWFVWDSTRGIAAGNDPHLSLNTAVAEVTTNDSIDPDSTGFVVNQLAATNINVTSATYIYLAIA